MKVKKILLVDDESFLLEVMEKIIRKWGYEVSVASNGRQALESIKNQRPDAVVLDYMMPEMDGVTTLEEIRKTDTSLPIIMFTAYYPDERALEAIKKLGLTAYIPKLDAYSDSNNTLKKTLEKIS